MIARFSDAGKHKAHASPFGALLMIATGYIQAAGFIQAAAFVSSGGHDEDERESERQGGEGTDTMDSSVPNLGIKNSFFPNKIII